MKIISHWVWSSRHLVSLVAVICIPAISVALAASPKAERVAGYKASKRAVAEIKDALDGGDLAAVAVPAEAMAAFAERLPSLYPREVGDGFVSASMEAILANFADFERKAEAFAANTRALSDLAANREGDAARLRQSLAQVQADCVACHRSYLGR